MTRSLGQLHPSPPKLGNGPVDLHGSASGVERLMACAPSGFLPQSDVTNRWQERGSVVDGFVRSVLSGTPIEYALKLIEDKATRETCRKLDFRRLGGDLSEVRCQVAYAIDIRTRTARELGVGINRAYASCALNDNEMPGTDDIEGIAFVHRGPCVLDVKAGYQLVTRCEDNGQMRFYCAAKMLVTGADAVEGRIAYVKPTGAVIVDSHMFTALELDTFLDELEDAVARAREQKRRYLAGGPLSVATGEHCKYCGALSWCPEYTRLAKAMLGEALDIEQRVSELTLPEAGAAYLKANDMQTILDRIFHALDARARQEWIPTRPGKAIRPLVYERRSFDTGAAIELLKKLGATDEEINSLYHAVAVEQIREMNDTRPKKGREAA